MYNLYQMLPSFNEFRGAIDRERNGESTGKSKPRQRGQLAPSAPRFIRHWFHLKFVGLQENNI